MVTAFSASRHLAANAQLMVPESIAEQRRRKSVKERAVGVWSQLLRQLDFGSVKVPPACIRMGLVRRSNSCGNLLSTLLTLFKKMNSA